MPAQVFTLGLESDIRKDVKAYFDRFGELRPGGLVVSGTSTPSGPESFLTLLKAFKKSGGKDFVVVVHGHEDGTGLYLPLAHDSKGRKAGHGTTADRLARLMKLGRLASPTITQDDREYLGLKDAQIQELLSAMNEVRGRELNTIEFRGCNLGKSDFSLKTFREFLGALRFAAPDLHSFFGSRPVGTGDHHLKTHTKSHAGTMHTYTTEYADTGSKLIQCIRVNSENKPRAGHLVATDTATVTRWLQEKIKADATHKGKDIPVHGLWERPKADPRDPVGFLDEEANKPRPIWPLEADYARHIRASIGARVEMRIYDFAIGGTIKDPAPVKIPQFAPARKL